MTMPAAPACMAISRPLASGLALFIRHAFPAFAPCRTFRIGHIVAVLPHSIAVRFLVLGGRCLRIGGNVGLLGAGNAERQC